MHASRRQIFAFIPIGLALATTGCAQLSKVTSDADTIANGVAAILPTIQAITGLSASVVAKVQAGIAVLKSAAASLSGAVAGGATTASQQLAAGLSAVTGALNGVNVPPWVSTVLSAAQTLLPVALQLAGVALAGPPSDGKATAQARAVLVAAAS